MLNERAKRCYEEEDERRKWKMAKERFMNLHLNKLFEKVKKVND